MKMRDKIINIIIKLIIFIDKLNKQINNNPSNYTNETLSNQNTR